MAARQRGSSIYGHKMIVIIAAYYYYCYQSQCQDLAQCTRRTGKAAKAKKRAWHKEGASKTAGREKEKERVRNCLLLVQCRVQKFMFCLFICLCSALWTVPPHTAQTHSRTPSCTHIRLYRRSSCKFIHLPRRYNKYSPKNISFQRLLSTCVHFRWLVTCRHHYRT